MTTIKLIGIVGPSGAGKSTLCKKLTESSKDYEHIKLDNYFKSPKTFPKKHGFRNWEVPSNLKFDLLLTHLKALKRGKIVTTKTFPKKAGTKALPLRLKPKPFIIVEGFMLFKNKVIRELLDSKIYLEIPPELMLSRRKIRFGVNHINDYDTKVAIPEFLKYGLIQKHYADVIIDATKTPAQVLKAVQRAIR